MDTTGSLFMPPQNSTMAAEIDFLWDFIYWASAVFFIVLGAAIVYFVFRYRRRRQGELTTGLAHNMPLEITWTLIPTILIFFVFVWGFKSYLKLHIAPGDAMEIKVTGQKWFWSFQYAEGASTVNELVVPVDKPVKLLMSSVDVIHSFFVPNFRVKMDVLPNRYTQLWFEATAVGEYDLMCTEYCGTGHSEMIGKVRVLGEREYAEWLESAGGMGEGMTPAEYGAQLYKNKACNTCHSIDGSKLVGPSFLNLYNTQQMLTNGPPTMADENYLRESILNPQAKLVAGYDPVMPSYQGVLKDQQIDALIAYIKSLKE
ncbi:MAG: cytochrome c oxidase subunit II [candidate division Zixibacteria bacterium]|nr:cytochrome c oxidase subunit II [candidate division Zixibacteria bacterium]